MNFYNVKCFVTLAEELNFTRASALLNVTQPTLSKIISTLESEIDCKLFERDRKSVRLTAAGNQFYADSLKILSTYTDSLSLCRDLEKGIKGIVKIGFIAVPFKHIMRKITDACYIYCPEIKLEYVEDKQAALLNYLSDGKIDIALFCNWGSAMLSKFSTYEIYRDEYSVIVSDRHPLAERDSVDMAELKNETFIVCKSPNSVQDYSFYEKADNSIIIHSLCSEAGFFPKTYAFAQTLLGMLMIVANNVGVSIGARHLEPICTDTRFLKIRNQCPTFSTMMAWNDNTASNSTLQIVNTIKELDFNH